MEGADECNGNSDSSSKQSDKVPSEEENSLGTGENGIDNFGVNERGKAGKLQGEQNDEEWSESSEEDDESDEDGLDENDIDSLLEQGLPKSKRLQKSLKPEEKGKQEKSPTKPASHEPTIKRITILDEKDENAFEVLPGDWIKVRHSSGLPLYLHRPSRVCTLAKPYYLGPASVRRHSVPLSAIPCLAYRRGLQKEQKDKQLMEEQAKVIEVSAEDGSEQGNDHADEETGTIENKLMKKLSSECAVANPQQPKRKRPAEKEPSENGKRTKQEDSNCADLPGNSGPDEDQTKDCDSTEPKVNGKEGTKCPLNTEENNVETVVSKFLQKTEVPSSLNKRFNNKRGGGDVTAGLKTLIPLAKVETARENASLYSVPPMELREYCKALFRFSVVECKRFKTWSARRMHSKEQKRKQLERPTLPDNAQVIKFFDLSDCKGGEEQMAKKFNDYVFNPNGKSSVCILHEFVQHALRKQPTYAFQELENAATPYAATVMINSTPYGKGLGSSKRTAKAAAAKATLEILIPQMKGQLNGNKTEPGSDFDITEYFQQVGMNDVRIAKLCASVSEPSPYTLLLTCLQRNYGQSGSTGVQFEMMPADLSKGNPPNQFKMTAGKETVIVTASNKREGKQLASQLLLSKLHPHIRNFGAFIKMYGNGSIKSVKEKKQEEQQITTLQSKASANSPNWAILEKLRHEMVKLAVQEQTNITQSTSSLCNSDSNADTREHTPSTSSSSELGETVTEVVNEMS